MENLENTTITEKIICLDNKFLTQDLTGITGKSSAYQDTYDWLINQPKEDLDIYQIQYLKMFRREMKRIDEAEKAEFEKLNKKAIKLGISVEELILKQSKPSEKRVAEYKYTKDEYDMCHAMLNQKLSTVEKVYWMQVDMEAKRFKTNESSKKSKAKSTKLTKK